MSAFSEAETYLRDFHRREPGATSAAFGDLPALVYDTRYASSYHTLTEIVAQRDGATTVLDLACGDGYLLGLLAARLQPALELIGVDMSEGELAKARAALPSSVRLLNERAQTLSLNDASVDVVLSHMALMLMDDIDGVIAGIHRVLKAGGRFGAIVGRGFVTGEAGVVFLDVFRAVAREHALRPIPFGDARTRSVEGWQSLLASRFTDIVCDDVDVPWHPTPAELADALRYTYDYDRLDETARNILRTRVIEALTPLTDARGRLDTGWALRRVSAIASN